MNNQKAQKIAIDYLHGQGLSTDNHDVVVKVPPQVIEVNLVKQTEEPQFGGGYTVYMTTFGTVIGMFKEQ